MSRKKERKTHTDTDTDKEGYGEIALGHLRESVSLMDTGVFVRIKGHGASLGVNRGRQVPSGGSTGNPPSELSGKGDITQHCALSQGRTNRVPHLRVIGNHIPDVGKMVAVLYVLFCHLK